ncbi:DUF6796 family protein [Winogradskyella immobilis]|uniref:histidine kinase n=1 Tax=Winogradskyella immobilis TaxID=2816852 RepID=A0ABS8ELD0_9FLAO|nr:DUF6796 family protein [Winogradskyella immobilis]MCC1483365.1 response regulator [Winogradskyella immobilis]MCG0015459.1 response regulator [Winogradskyella immobilis]
MRLTKIIGLIGLLGFVSLIFAGEYLLYYSNSILEHPNNYSFFKFKSLNNLTTILFLSTIGLPLYFASYIYIYRVLKSENKTLARIILITGFVAFIIGGFWIGSRESIENIIHLKESTSASNYQNILEKNTHYMNMLRQILYVVIIILSVVFAIIILKGNKYYKKANIKEVFNFGNKYDSLKEEFEINIRELEETTEKVKKTSELKSQFLANMSHEIRSPLNGVIGMLNLIKSQDLSAQQIAYMEIAENSADHLIGLVDMILDHSKLQTGIFVLNADPLNIKRELNKLVRLFEYRSLDKNIKLNFSFDPAIENNILGDNIRIQQVLINLLDNAIKFTDIRSVTLKAELISKEDDIQNVRFKITDTGIGIDEDKAKNILSAFEQIDHTNTRKYGGTGIGLTIAYQIIKIMKGSLGIVNNPKKGCCFYFEVPLKIDTNKVGLIEKELNHLKVPTDYNRSKAIIAEDNLINQKVIVNFLKRLNIEADVATNGLEALTLFKEHEYDLIFMDLHMPVMDGFTSVSEIKKLPKYQENPLPIIAVTASAFPEDRAKSLANGMHDFITKPIIFNKLQETIFKHMSDDLKE